MNAPGHSCLRKQRSRATPKANQKKKDSDPLPLHRTRATNGVQPTFLSGHILGSPSLMVTKLNSQVTKWDKGSYLWERKDRQSMVTWRQIHKSQFEDLILTIFFFFFPCRSEFGEEGSVKFYLLSTRHHRWRYGEVTLAKILTLCQLLQFSQDLSAVSRASGVSQQVPSWSPEAVEGDK